MQNEKLQLILEIESGYLQKLNDIVQQSVDEEKLLSEKLAGFEDLNPPLSSVLVDKIATFGGSWKFIASFLLFMILWIIANAYLLSRAFDPYPFILLNLMLSTVAALQAPVIMMSQNRKEDKDRQRAIHDYMINLKAEIEIRNLHQKLDLLMAEQMRTVFEIQKIQLEVMEDIQNGIKVSGRKKRDV
jgi:uncharacterized membrane protein